MRPVTPCIPSPCGLNADCRVMDTRPVCSCLPGMLGAPPNCRPECIINQDCPPHLACINKKCQNPCFGSCGINADCTVLNHKPMCICASGFEGDPFTGCQQIGKCFSYMYKILCAFRELVIFYTPTLLFLFYLCAFLVHVEPLNPCNPSPCGANTVCKERNGYGSCTCLPGYFGDAYVGCRPECLVNNDCPLDKACLNKKCRDPCSGSCGVNAECRVINHNPICSCLPGYLGNALRFCQERLPDSKISIFFIWKSVATSMSITIKFFLILTYLC